MPNNYEFYINISSLFAYLSICCYSGGLRLFVLAACHVTQPLSRVIETSFCTVTFSRERGYKLTDLIGAEQSNASNQLGFHSFELFIAIKNYTRSVSK